MIRRFASFILQLIGQNSPLARCWSFVPSHYRTIKQFEPDIIQCHDLSTLPLGAICAKELGAKLIFDSHELEAFRNPPLPYFQRKQVEYLEGRYLPQCDAVTTVSDSIEEYLRTHFKLETTEVIVNSPKLVPGKSNPRWKRKQGYCIRTDFGAQPHEFLVVYVGLITVNRGLELALEAMAKLPEHYVLAAVGPYNVNVKRELIEMGETLGLGRRFRILDPVDPPTVYKYLRTADAAIMPSIPVTLSYELGLPNKFFECGFAGLPLISANSPEFKRLIEEFELGTTFDPLEVEDCIAAIHRVGRNKRAYRPKPENLRRFKEQYSWEAQSKKLIQLTHSIEMEEPK
jgi:glycogen(starch) synthase